MSVSPLELRYQALSPAEIVGASYRCLRALICAYVRAPMLIMCCGCPQAYVSEPVGDLRSFVAFEIQTMKVRATSTSL